MIGLYGDCRGVTGSRSRTKISEDLLCCRKEFRLYSEDTEKLLNDFKE